MASGNTSSSSSERDARAYNALVSAATDVTQAHAHDGILTLVRSTRDIDADSRRKFLYRILLPSNHYHDDNKPPSSSLPPMELSDNVRARIPSPSGDKIAIFLEEPSNQKSSKKRHVVEIWTDRCTSLSRRIVLPVDKLHGAACYDTAWFGSFSWNVQETALVYSAEMLPPSTESFFRDRSDGDGTKDDDDDKVISGGEHTLGLGRGEDWGEKYTTTCRLNLYCLHVGTGNVAMVPNVPGRSSDDGTTATTTTEGGYVLGQAVFTPCGTEVAYTGWDAGSDGTMPRRLGSIYCYQRSSKIYVSPVRNLLERLGRSSSKGDDEEEAAVKDGPFYCVTPEDRLARSPRFSSIRAKDGEGAKCQQKLLFLCNTRGFDTHGGCMGLHTLDWEDDVEKRTGPSFGNRELVSPVGLVPTAEDGDDISDTVGGMAFPGLFVDQLPGQPCTSPDGEYLFATTQWGYCRKIIRINLNNGELVPIHFTINIESEGGTAEEHEENWKDASQRLLCITEEGDAIVSQSTPGRPPVVGMLSADALTTPGVHDARLLANLSPITATSAFPSSCDSISNGDIKHYKVTTSPEHGDVSLNLQAILLLNKSTTNSSGGDSTKKVPLIVVPHGGPHGCTSTSYVPSYAFLCQRGYAILHVNYRGSSGYGQSSLESLAGEIGSLDVKDVVALTKQALEDHGDVLDVRRVGVCGGSHGGFLSGHLIGQYPELYKVAAMRNPVTNIASMVTHTDIPDWCYVEALGREYDWSQFKGPTKEELVTMWEKSPIAHVENVSAPTLVALGMADKRVPPSQGLEFYHHLRSKGVPTKLLVYEKDDHAIDRPVSEADHWVNIKQWFDTHL